MQQAVDLLLALAIAILDEVVQNQVIMTFLAVAVITCCVGLILNIVNIGLERRKA